MYLYENFFQIFTDSQQFKSLKSLTAHNRPHLPDIKIL